ncbi:MAG: GNAT family N-acetyltransferase [Candidatus Zixiibacteriota bacterium]|nr:MAG: GNAT family N-acetyltransferase [candidate division Zixibacteria bacterium]
MFKDVIIETPRLLLRPFTLDDIEAFHAILSQPEVMHYLPESVMTIDEVRKIVEWYQMTYERNTPENIIKWTLAVCLKSEGIPQQAVGHPDSTGSDTPVIGWAGVGPLEFDESQTEIFYGLSSEHWGKGYAHEAAQAVLDYAFDTIGLKRLVGVAKPENVASVKILEKIGMVFEKKLVGLDEKFKNDEGSYFYAKTV